MKRKTCLMCLVIFIFVISGCSANTNQKTIEKKNKSNHEETAIIDKAEKLPKSIKKSAIAKEEYGTAEIAGSLSDEESFEMASVIISGKVTDVYSTVSSGLITTIANVKVTDSIKGTFKKGDNISVTMKGGYAKIEQMIESYPKEDREGTRKGLYGSLTDEEIKSKYSHQTFDGYAELMADLEGVFCLVPSKDVPNAYCSVRHYGDIYMKLPNGEYRKPNAKPYERLAELSRIPDEEKANQISRDEDGYVDSFKIELITYEELMEKINSVINK